MNLVINVAVTSVRTKHEEKLKLLLMQWGIGFDRVVHVFSLHFTGNLEVT